MFSKPQPKSKYKCETSGKSNPPPLIRLYDHVGVHTGLKKMYLFHMLITVFGQTKFENACFMFSPKQMKMHVLCFIKHNYIVGI